jgi:hypothetical protein
VRTLLAYDIVIIVLVVVLLSCYFSRRTQLFLQLCGHIKGSFSLSFLFGLESPLHLEFHELISSSLLILVEIHTQHACHHDYHQKQEVSLGLGALLLRHHVGRVVHRDLLSVGTLVELLAFWGRGLSLV